MWRACKIVLFTLAVPATVTAWLPWLWLRAWHGATPVSVVLGIPVICLGVLVYCLCAWDFGASGEGTPAPWDAPRRLVRNRLYTSVRNPMYLGVLTVLLGEAVLFHSRLLLEYLLVVWVGFHIFVLLVEEPILRRKFSESYAAYCAATPRWIPRLRAR